MVLSADVIITDSMSLSLLAVLEAFIAILENLNLKFSWGNVVSRTILVCSHLQVHIIPPPLENPLRRPCIGLLIDSHMALFYWEETGNSD